MPTYSRRYGRTFEGLDNLPIASLCYREIGKVTVDCRFQVSKSQWGLLGEQSYPAGIVYMDLSFDQPKDYRLHSATVFITLEEGSDDTVILQKGLHITDYYGPKHLSGTPKDINTKKIYHLTPQVNVCGTGGGGVGLDSEKTVTYNGRWTFTGHLLPAQSKRRTRSMYRTLKWELTENDLERQSLHSTLIHTGFVFQHSDAPFLMRLEIKGKLLRNRDRLRSMMSCFPPPHNKDQGSSTTLVRPDGAKLFRRRLDQIAQSLPNAMEMENYQAVSVEMPDALPVSFQEVAATSTTDVKTNGSNRPEARMNSYGNMIHDASPVTDNLTQQPQGRISNAVPTLSDLNVNHPTTDRCIADLQQAVDVFSHLQHEDCNQQMFNMPVSSGSRTAANHALSSPKAQMLDDDTTKKESEPSVQAAGTLSTAQSPHNNPVFLLLIQMIANLLSFISIKRGSAGQISEEFIEETVTIANDNENRRGGTDGGRSYGGRVRIQKNGTVRS